MMVSNKSNWEKVQKALKQRGFYNMPLVVDGIVGPGTRKAVQDFKTSIGFNPRFYVGPLTLASLGFSETEVEEMTKAKSAEDGLPSYAWMETAWSLEGTREITGSKNNPVIMNWADDLDIWYPNDEVPWCGLFVAHCMNVGAPNDPQPSNVLGARNWGSYGRKVTPGYGSVLVFWRTHKTKSWNGHVGLYVGEDSTTYYVLGGNQSNKVNVARISKSRLLSANAPLTEDWSPLIVNRNTGGIISTNEA